MPNPQTRPSRVREGDVLAGKYRIERTLGVGGTGVVVAARHLQLDAPVAIKFLLPEALENAEAVARFALEAQAAVKVKSEHVARVIDVGSLPDGAPYMVMEYLDGSDMEAWLAQRGPLPTAQAVELVLQACEAVAEAHSLGIVHRDLKPANLFVIHRPDGTLSIKVLDFGISKYTAPEASEPRLTRPSALVGTPLYMSPEQLKSSASTDARTDIWALGVILYELLTGQAPFKGESVPQVALEVVSAPTPSLRDKRPDAPEGLEQVIACCLEKEPERRFESVAALAFALVQYGPRRAGISLQRIRGVMRVAGLPSSALEAPEPPHLAKLAKPAKLAHTPASWGHTAAGSSSHRNAWLASLVAVVMMITGAGLASYVLRKPPPLPLTAHMSEALPATATVAATPAPAVADLPVRAAGAAIPPPPASARPTAPPLEPEADKPAPRPGVPRASKLRVAPARATASVPAVTTFPPLNPAPATSAPAARSGVYDDRK